MISNQCKVYHDEMQRKAGSMQREARSMQQECCMLSQAWLAQHCMNAYLAVHCQCVCRWASLASWRHGWVKSARNMQTHKPPCHRAHAQTPMVNEEHTHRHSSICMHHGSLRPSAELQTQHTLTAIAMRNATMSAS